MTADYIRSLLGQRVRVTLTREGAPNHPIITVGQFLGWGDGGDFEILEDDGCVHYCWPLLKIEPEPITPTTSTEAESSG